MSLGNENVCVCTVRQGSHWPQVAGEHLKYSQCDWAPKLSPYLILIDWKLNLDNHMELVAAVFIATPPWLCRPSGARQRFPLGVLGGHGRTGTCCAVGKTTSGVSSGFSLSSPGSARPRGCADSVLYPPPQLLYPTWQTGTRGGTFTRVPLPLGARAALQNLWFIHCKSSSLAAPWCDLRAAGAVPVRPGP